jgi:hypothetical protein
MERIKVSVNMPEYFHPSQNEKHIHIVEPTEEYP